MSDEPIDVGDAEQVNSRKKRFQLEQDRRLEDFLTVVSTPEGRSVVWQILEMCGVYKVTYYGDVHQAFINEGKRAVGLEIHALFAALKEVGEEKMFSMIREANQRERRVKDG